MDGLINMAERVISQVNQVILGKENEVEEIMIAFLAGGHVLLEDIPGVGKTTLALAFAKGMNLNFKRVQFTPDVMPSDLVGFSMYKSKEERFVYQPGSVFCNLLLADELNRTSPKTQSALLEVMEERKVTVEGVTRKVPSPFLVIATQNPPGSSGTQRLPEAQADRFMITMSIGYPDFENELAMALAVNDQGRIVNTLPVITQEILLEMQTAIHNVYLSEEVGQYLLELITATRNHAYLETGASPRATISLVKLSRAMAWLQERSFVTPDDVMKQFQYAVPHRISLNPATRMANISREQIVAEIIHTVKKPGLTREGSKKKSTVHIEEKTGKRETATVRFGEFAMAKGWKLG